MNIHFGLTGYGRLHYLMNIAKVLAQIDLEEKKMSLAQDKEKYKHRIANLKKKIDKEEVKLEKHEQKAQTEVVNAYVTFRSMEGKERALYAFRYTACKRCCLMCCFRAEKVRKKLFYGRWLRVKQAISPDLINWQNLSVGTFGKYTRLILIYLVAIFLIILSFSCIIYAKSVERDAMEYSPQIDCPKQDVTMEDAFLDQQKDQDKRIGLIHCYCLSEFLKSGLSVRNIEFSDGETYCDEWLTNYTLANLWVLFTAMIIVFINVLAKALLRFISRFERAKDRTYELVSSTFKMFILQFLNTGVVILLVNLDLGVSYRDFPIFEGEYPSFTVQWYRVIGSTLVLMMLFNSISPHLSNLAFQMLFGTLRCCDRRCTCDSKRTKKLL